MPNSLSLAWNLGLAVLRAQASKADPVDAVLQVYGGQGVRLLDGKVVDVERKTQEGFVRGNIRISTGSAPSAGAAAAAERPVAELSSSIVVEFQNENLIARAASSSSSSEAGGRVLACVPDLICLLETGSGAAVATEELRYGLLVSVVVLPAHPLLCTPEALQVVGPAAFGYEGVAYQPVGKYPVQMLSVHDEHHHSGGTGAA